MAQVSRPNVESHVKGFLKAAKSATTEMPVDQARATYTYATTVGDKPALSGTEVIEKTINDDGLAVCLHITSCADDKTGRAINN
jgi:hypothetical protein